MPTKYKTPFNHLFNPGHTACAGCGQALAARLVVDALGPNTMLSNATGCLEVFSSKYPESAWKVPWIHSLFENPAAIASGMAAALRTKGEDKEINVVAQGGDGSTFDIGFGLISGMWQRRENILYICYDNEAYMNTGVQSSGATPCGAYTTTTPAGKKSTGAILTKKNLPAIAVAHGLSYVATATAGHALDLEKKVKKALTFSGPKYIQILVPCTPGWNYESNLTIEACRLAQKTGHYPIFEVVEGKITEVMKVPAKPPKVEAYLKTQARFKHLFKTPVGLKQIKILQKRASENIKVYGLGPGATSHEIMIHHPE